MNHFRGSKIVEELEGMNNLEDFLKDLKKANVEEYCSLFKYFVINFETIIKEKKSRIRTKKWISEIFQGIKTLLNFI